MPVLFSVNSDFPLSSSSLLDSSGSSGTQGSLDFFHMGKFGFFPLTNSIPFQLFKQNNKTKLCRRSDCTTPGVFLISMGFFFVCLFNNQPESFQSPSRRAFPFPPSFLPPGAADLPLPFPAFQPQGGFSGFSQLPWTLSQFATYVCHLWDLPSPSPQMSAEDTENEKSLDFSISQEGKSQFSSFFA